MASPPAAPRAVVDHALTRRAALRALQAGRTPRDDACDADVYLRRAARFHGIPAPRACPVCDRRQLWEVSWVYGENLGALSGSAQDPAGLLDLAGRFAEFTVHAVEVCRGCGWNHLLRSYVLGAESGGISRRTRRRAGTRD